MILKKQLLTYIRQQPFRPFRIVFNSGRQYDIKHPELIKVTDQVAVIFDPVADSTEPRDPPSHAEIEDWHTVSLDLIEHVEYVQKATA